MPIVMNSNVSALTAQRYLAIAQRNLEAGTAVLAQANQLHSQGCQKSAAQPDRCGGLAPIRWSWGEVTALHC